MAGMARLALKLVQADAEYLTRVLSLISWGGHSAVDVAAIVDLHEGCRCPIADACRYMQHSSTHPPRPSTSSATCCRRARWGSGSALMPPPAAGALPLCLTAPAPPAGTWRDVRCDMTDPVGDSEADRNAPGDPPADKIAVPHRNRCGLFTKLKLSPRQGSPLQPALAAPQVYLHFA